jgi:hypothetical protein
MSRHRSKRLLSARSANNVRTLLQNPRRHARQLTQQFITRSSGATAHAAVPKQNRASLNCSGISDGSSGFGAIDTKLSPVMAHKGKRRVKNGQTPKKTQGEKSIHPWPCNRCQPGQLFGALTNSAIAAVPLISAAAPNTTKRGKRPYQKSIVFPKRSSLRNLII